jgi:cytochrome P450
LQEGFLHFKVLSVSNVLTPTDIENLTYLHQVLKESMRVNTPGPFAARMLDEDLDISGFKLTKGTVLFYPLSAILHNPEYWPEPDKFDPERFTPEQVLQYCNVTQPHYVR